MRLKLFCLMDNVSNDALLYCSAPNCPTVIRQYLNAVVQSHPLKDIDIFEIGDVDGLTLYPCSPKKHSWNEYEFPINKADAIAPLGAPSDVVEKAFAEKTSDVSHK